MCGGHSHPIRHLGRPQEGILKAGRLLYHISASGDNAIFTQPGGFMREWRGAKAGSNPNAALFRRLDSNFCDMRHQQNHQR
jgi:hypothetical protein